MLLERESGAIGDTTQNAVSGLAGYTQLVVDPAMTR
jgi:hypothetical protein